MLNRDEIKILIIEDEIFLSEMLKKFFLIEGYQVFLAKNGEEGLKKIKEINPTLMLLDILLPKISGYQVLKTLRKDSEFSQFSSIPIIVISNSGQAVEIKKIKELGVSDYLLKVNLTAKEIVDKVNNFLKNNYLNF
ncbi:response regulator [Candidatus Kuenenbacteria bacterium HGW-Kuenenbacteria-1]|uniref:Response regulator n=1 Tax=Candidatus Kuenenbacteria bacterium HGW-Kuenenbacteria-1 TaxID=2013812 RepID=A0A2N1UNI7_9BACT|nr:MAG: response regulator [Candidatus Kuenenbacteria bacterium HGW-Kuenenbacteria-1]